MEKWELSNGQTFFISNLSTTYVMYISNADVMHNKFAILQGGGVEGVYLSCLCHFPLLFSKK